MSIGVVLLAALAVAGLVQSGIFTLQTWENRRFARARLRSQKRKDGATPKVLLVSPCKGVDVGLEANLQALLEQDYADYEIAFVVESIDDPAVPTIRNLITQHAERSIRMVVAGVAQHCGQKVHNLRAATADLPADIAVLAFVDSDARPAADWLRSLVARLDRDEVGATTGYRLMVPTRATPGNVLLYCINSTIALIFGPGGHHLVWGGSWAMRRDVFDTLRLRDAWQGTLSDDLVVSRELAKAGLKIEFIPECLVVSPVESPLSATCEFVRRQYLITHRYAARYWFFGFAVSMLAQGSFWTMAVATAVAARTGSPWLPYTATVLAFLYAGHVERGILRQDLTRRVLVRKNAVRSSGVKLSAAIDVLCGPAVGLVNLVLMASSAVGDTITWRGNTYRIHRGGAIDVLRLGGQLATPSTNRNRSDSGESSSTSRAA